MKNPFFTIVTAVLNGEKYIEETINSIKNQSFKNLKPKLDVDNEPLPPPSPQTTPLSQLTQNNEIDFKIDSLKKEINKTQNSTVSSKKKGLALNNLNEQLKNYQDLKDNQIEY